ncbi:hypothetical protein SDC9_113190 [bioreactor metagenome]|uniref:Uncharacterized protein n=1 Tax=bioreactor metagenome TaxID=1076179 RepID=A0A645BSR7_9ZZZZ
MGVERVPAPAACALEIEAPFAVGLDRHFARRMHDRVQLGKRVGDLHVIVLERHVHERDLAVFARQRHRLDAAEQAATAFLNHLEGELLVGLDAVGTDHVFHQLADHVAARDTGLLIENPVLGCAHRALRFMQPVAQRLVVHAGLAAGDHVAVAKALGLAGGHRSRRDRAGVDDVGHAAHPADQPPFPEDRHDGGDVAGVDVADRAVVVGEHVAWVDAGVGLPVVFDHVLDGCAHGADVDDDPGRCQHAVAHRVVEREAQLAFLLDDGAGGNLLGRLAGMHQAAAQLGEQLLVADGVAVAELQLGQSVVGARGIGAGDDFVAVLLEGLAVLQQIGDADLFVAHHVHGVSP